MARGSVSRGCQEERGIRAPEAERVGQGGTHGHFPGLARDVVQAALGVGVLEVDRRGQDPCRHGVNTKDRLDRSGGTKKKRNRGGFQGRTSRGHTQVVLGANPAERQGPRPRVCPLARPLLLGGGSAAEPNVCGRPQRFFPKYFFVTTQL